MTIKRTFLTPDGTLLPPASPHRKSLCALCGLPSNATLQDVLTALKTATAHITSQSDHLRATLSTGELFIGTLDEITALLRERNIAADDVTMPDKNDPESPTTGQRIAINHALHGTEPDDIEARRKHIEIIVGSDRLEGIEHDLHTLEMMRWYVAGEITIEDCLEDVREQLRRYHDSLR